MFLHVTYTDTTNQGLRAKAYTISTQGNHSFSQIAKEYVEQQKRRAATGQVSDARWRKCQSVIKARLDLYVGSTQIHLIGQDRWDDYPTWRREHSKGRLREQVSDATISASRCPSSAP